MLGMPKRRHILRGPKILSFFEKNIIDGCEITFCQKK
jgi:hypothetical protein